MLTTTRRRPNYWTGIVSVALMLFLLGLFGIFLLQGRQLIKTARESVDLIIEFTADARRGDVQRVQQFLEVQPFIRTGSIDYRSKEEAVEEMRNDLGDDFTRLNLDNPFHDLVTFNVTELYLQPDSLAAIRTLLREEASITDVFYQESVISKVLTNLRRVTLLTLILGIAMLTVAIWLIHNTVKLALSDDRFLIKNQELVGAEWSFISRPYLQRAFVNGLLSGLLAVVGLLLVLFWIVPQFGEGATLFKGTTVVFFLSTIVLIGIVVVFGSTWWVLQRYLNLRTEELY